MYPHIKEGVGAYIATLTPAGEGALLAQKLAALRKQPQAFFIDSVRSVMLQSCVCCCSTCVSL